MKRLSGTGLMSLFFVAAFSLTVSAAGMGGGMGMGGYGAGTGSGMGMGGYGSGMRGPGYGPGYGVGSPGLTCSGTVETLTGTLVSYGNAGGGITIDTGTEIEELYGVGPFWYWNSNNMDTPEVGETVTVTAETATVGSTERDILISMTIGGQTIQLRDQATCLPLWRGQQRPMMYK
ncbi:MAG: hypothetical protein K8I29_12635 [Alphaproteobacteria bacterium]|uniref:DUF5666 domain-containing protein n=1 Tax=Candidatus Nitrobium versatile TaxID=2884831 RepID=A0A953J7C4_9BACT|nr:hypothetical protein [Candidatus Nitrobium versatile]